jgi:hypothetical protein
MLKKFVLAGAIAIASLIPLNLGAQTPPPSAPSAGSQCYPTQCGMFVCYQCV